MMKKPDASSLWLRLIDFSVGIYPSNWFEFHCCLCCCMWNEKLHHSANANLTRNIKKNRLNYNNSQPLPANKFSLSFAFSFVVDLLSANWLRSPRCILMSNYWARFQTKRTERHLNFQIKSQFAFDIYGRKIYFSQRWKPEECTTLNCRGITLNDRKYI